MFVCVRKRGKNWVAGQSSLSLFFFSFYKGSKNKIIIIERFLRGELKLYNRCSVIDKFHLIKFHETRKFGGLRVSLRFNERPIASDE